MANNYNISNINPVGSIGNESVSNKSNNVVTIPTNVTESLNLGSGLSNLMSAGASIFSGIVNNVLSPQNIELMKNAAFGFLSSTSSMLSAASAGMFGMLADNGMISHEQASTWANQTAAFSEGATKLFDDLANKQVDYDSVIPKINNVANNYVDTLGTLTGVVNEALANPTAETAMRGNAAANDLIPVMTGGSKDMLTSMIQLPSFTIDKLHYALNDAFNSVLKYKNQSLGIDRTGEHQGDVITTVGDSVLSGWLLPDYMKKLGEGENVIDGVVALKNIEGSAPILLGEQLDAKVNQMQYPGIRTDELRYVLDENFRNSDSTWTISDEKKAFLDAHRAEYIDYITNSDTVVLDIGWNNVQHIGNAFGVVGDYFNASFNNDLPLDQKISQAVSNLPNYLPNFMKYAERAVGSYTVDYPAIMTEIYKLNPNATLCVVGGYNPLEDVDLSSWVGGNIDDDITSAAATAFFDTTLEAYKKGLCLLYPGEAVYADMSGIEILGNSPQEIMGGTVDWHPTSNGVVEQANKLVTALGGQSMLETHDVRSMDDDSLQLRYGAALDRTIESIKALFDNN